MAGGAQLFRGSRDDADQRLQRHFGRRAGSPDTEESDAMDLEEGVFNKSAKEIAKSLKKSVGKSKRRKGTPFQSAMSMLNFYINRAGKNLKAADIKRLDQAKVELRKLFDKE